MRRIPIWAGLAAAVFVGLWKLTSGAGAGAAAIAQRVAERCERMMASMPASFPPNRMMADLEAINERTARILEMLEGSMEVPPESGHG